MNTDDSHIPFVVESSMVWYWHKLFLKMGKVIAVDIEKYISLR